MAKEVVLTPLAEDDFYNVIEYLLVNWGSKTANNFIDRFERILKLIAENTDIFPFFDRNKQLQKCVLTKHNILYFQQRGEIVKIITIFDTRQDPQRLSSLI